MLYVCDCKINIDNKHTMYLPNNSGNLIQKRKQSTYKLDHFYAQFMNAPKT